MAVTETGYQIVQKIAADEYLVLHPETDGEVVKVAADGIEATNVNAALEEIAAKVGAIPGGGKVYPLVKTDFEASDDTVLSTIESPKNGDVAVVSTVVDDITYSVGSYYYDGGWKAIDGNVDADKVILRKNFKLAGNYTAVGNLNKGSNSATVETDSKGKSVEEFFEAMLSKEEQPTIVADVSGSVTLADAGAKEVGSMFTPSYSTSFNKGKYSYKPEDTGVTVTSYAITDSNENSAATASGFFAEFQVKDDTNYKITAVITYSDGAVALTNLDKPSSPVVQIKGGTLTKYSAAVTGFRPMFVYVGTETAALDGAWVRSKGTNKGNSVTPGTLTVAEGTKRVMFAVPAAKKLTLKSVIDVDGMGLDVKDNFTHVVLSVEGANQYAGADYDVWYVDNANGLAATKYTVTLG